jgi:hypothetical protein
LFRRVPPLLLLLVEFVGEVFLFVLALPLTTELSLPDVILNFSRLFESSERMRLMDALELPEEPPLFVELDKLPVRLLGSESFLFDGIMLVTMAISFCILISFW